MLSQDSNEIVLPISLGEALDKLTILDIKMGKLTNQKYIEVKKEYDLLYSKLNHYLLDSSKSYLFYYNCLKRINLDIWNQQDEFRITTDKLLQNKLCNNIIYSNDNRFRIKNKINISSDSHIKEQKGYVNTSAFILTHLDLGDNITAISAVRYLSTCFDQVTVVCKYKNGKNVEMFYKDDPSIKLHLVEGDKDISHMFVDICSPEKFLSIIKDSSFFSCGMHIGKGINNIPYDFYDHMNLDKSIFWDYFYIPSLPSSTKLFNLAPKEYVFIHNSTSKCEVFNLDNIKKDLYITIDDILFINPLKSHYPINHPLYDLSRQFINHPLPYYKDIIENAKINIHSGSSFFCMAINLSIKSTSNYYYSSSNYDHIWTDIPHPSSKRVFKRLSL